jgi:2'-5' RNA ligase
MEQIRAFIALEMPEPIRRSLSEISSRLKSQLSAVPLGWVPIQNMHLTLKFLGNVKNDQLENIKGLLGSLIEKYSSFQISLNGLGTFPNAKRARVLWVGVEAPGTLKEIVADFESGFAELGFEPEGRPFAAHLTLARVRGHANQRDLLRIGDVLRSAPMPQPVSAVADKVVLFQSELRPVGSVYNPLAQFVLSDIQEPS